MPKSAEMDGDRAMALAASEFEKHHPRETLPEWFRPCTVMGYTRDKRGRFVVSFTVTLKEPLHAFEHWEKLEGNWYVVRVDPTTSEKLVVFRSPPTVKYFEAAVDPQTAEVAVMLDRDPLSFREEELMREPGP